MNQKLFERLQNVVENMSVNALSSVYPGQLAEWLNASQTELKEFVEDLYAERLITYKYKFQCRCGNNCTAYARKLKREPYICNECDAIYDMDLVTKKGILVYELDKSDILEFTYESIDLKKESIKSLGMADLLDFQDSGIKEKKRMEIFLGSSSEAINEMEKIGYILEQLKHKPLLWNSAGNNIFLPNTNTIDSLIAITKRVQAAIFIFNEDDKTWHHNSLKATKTVRDNVLFEYGLFCGALNKSRVCFVCKGKPSLASDLEGITYIDVDEGDITIKLKLQDWINAM